MDYFKEIEYLVGYYVSSHKRAAELVRQKLQEENLEDEEFVIDCAQSIARTVINHQLWKRLNEPG